MRGLIGLVAGAAFIALLASGDRDVVPCPKSNWDDNVARSIKSNANKNISRYNDALRSCKDSLSSVKTSAELSALEVEFNSKANDLNWWASRVDNVDVNRIVSDINRILGE